MGGDPMSAVKRICVMYPDGSVNIYSGKVYPGQELNDARRERDNFNKAERDKRHQAAVGEIMVDLMTFKEIL